MKKVAILLSLAVLFAVSCTKSDLETIQQVSNVSATPCKQGILKSSGLSDKSDKVDVEFTNKGVEITHYNFEVACDFTTVNVTHTLVNGVLKITQQGTPNQANCVCYTDVSYTIEGISQDEVNVIFINGKQVYCYNDNGTKEIINVQYIRRFGEYKGAQYPMVSIISTKSELEQYYETYVSSKYDSYPNVYTGDFLDATKNYSDDFFRDNFLVIVLLEEGSGSIRHKVERIDKNGDIIITRLLPEVGTADMAEWNIIIELDSDFKLDQYGLVLVDKYLTYE